MWNKARILVMTVLLAVALFPGPASAAPEQKTYASPSDAARALVEACAANQGAELLAILGDKCADLVSSGDATLDKQSRAWFVAQAKASLRLVRNNDGTVSLVYGNDAQLFPFPLVQAGGRWHFDTTAGVEEVINTRIGANERAAISFCATFVAAQRDYATVPRGDEPIIEYARQFTSTEGKHDGLYWPTASGADLSPLGPFAIAALEKGITAKDSPVAGYHYRILTRQGANAAGGAYDYVINGHMVGGYALVAWPVKYGQTGVMTFLVNQNGIVYQKNLGPDTATVVETIDSYNPDDTWASQ